MTPARLAVAVGVLGAAAFVGVALLTGPSEGARPAAGPAEPSPDADAGAGAARPAELVPASLATVSEAAPAAPREWSQVELAVRPAELGPDLAAPVSDGLDALRDSMDRCFAAERAHPHRPALRGQAAQGPAILVLHLEATTPGRLAVAGTEVETTGFSSRELVECCRAATKGYELAAPAVEAGRRVRVKLLLQ